MWQVREGLAGSKQFGSTGSVNSAGSDGEVKLAGVHHSSLYQVNCNLLLPYLFLFFSSNLFRLPATTWLYTQSTTPLTTQATRY